MVNKVYGQDSLWTGIANTNGLQTNSVAFSADGKHLLTGTNCHPAMIRLFHSETGELEWSYELGQELYCVMGVGISSGGKYLAAIEEFGNLLVFDYTKSPPDSVTTIKIEATNAFASAFSPNNDQVAVGASNGVLALCDLEKGEVVKSVQAHGNWVLCVAYSPDGQTIATAGDDNRIKTWDLEGNQLGTFSGHSKSITSITFSKDGKQIYSSSQDQTLRVWDVEKNTETASVKVSDVAVNDFHLSPTGYYLATVSADDTVRLFFTEGLVQFASFKDQIPGTAYCMSWSSVAPMLAVGTTSGKVGVYSVDRSLGQSTISRAHISPFPNPFSSSLRVEGDFMVRLELYDVRGQLTAIRHVEHQESVDWNLRDLGPGVYVLKAIGYNEQVMETKKVIKL